MSKTIKSVSVFLCVAALALIAARFFSGIVYGDDAPTSSYVLKRTPSPVVEQQIQPSERITDRFVVLEEEESHLLFQSPYVFLMQWCPVLAPAFILMAAGLLLIQSRSNHPRRTEARTTA